MPDNLGGSTEAFGNSALSPNKLSNIKISSFLDYSAAFESIQVPEPDRMAEAAEELSPVAEARELLGILEDSFCKCSKCGPLIDTEDAQVYVVCLGKRPQVV